MQSSISQLTLDDERRLSATLDPEWRIRLGRELRRLRIQRGMTQASLGTPLTKGFVSAVEHGRTVPSLPALRLMVDRLDLTLGEFFAVLDAVSTSS